MDILRCLTGGEVRREGCSNEAGVLIVDKLFDLTLNDVEDNTREEALESKSRATAAKCSTTKAGDVTSQRRSTTDCPWP